MNDAVPFKHGPEDTRNFPPGGQIKSGTAKHAYSSLNRTGNA